MPRRKKVIKVTKKKGKSARKQSASSLVKRISKISWTESYSSFLLGIVVVIVAVLFVVTLIRQNHSGQTSSISTGPTATVAPTPGSVTHENGKTYYFVKADDSLWNIAVAVYNDGDKWVDIAKANNLANPSTIFKGDKLYIPNAPEPSELGQLIQPTPTETSDAIKDNSYTVKKGDSLWSIAVRSYADGYQWVKIAKANNLSNPDMIFSDNVLQIPR